MNRIDFGLPEGFPVENKTFEFLQSTYTQAIRSLSLAFGDNLILHGVELQGTQRTAGAIVYNGEVIPFVSSPDAEYIVIEEQVETAIYQSQQVLPAYFTKTARCSAVMLPNSFLLSDLRRLGEKPAPTGWQDVEYLGMYSSPGNTQMKSRIDESGKGVVFGSFVIHNAVNTGFTQAARLSFAPKFRKTVPVCIYNSSAGGNEQLPYLDAAYVDTDGILYVDNTFYGFVNQYGWVSAIIDLD